jgi:TonB family protein
MSNFASAQFFVRLSIGAIILFLTFGMVGCATDSSDYHYEVSAYQKGDKPVHVIYRPKMTDYYTRIAKGYAESGITELTLSLDEFGKVTNVELFKGSGYGRLDTSAIDLAYSMVFVPASVGEKTPRKIQLFVNFHKEKIIPPVKVTNVTSRVELLTGFQYRVIVGAIANPQGFMESVYPLAGSVQVMVNEEALGYGSRYILEEFPENQRPEKQDLRLQITFN